MWNLNASESISVIIIHAGLMSMAISLLTQYVIISQWHTYMNMYVCMYVCKHRTHIYMDIARCGTVAMKSEKIVMNIHRKSDRVWDRSRNINNSYKMAAESYDGDKTITQPTSKLRTKTYASRDVCV